MSLQHSNWRITPTPLFLLSPLIITRANEGDMYIGPIRCRLVVSADEVTKSFAECVFHRWVTNWIHHLSSLLRGAVINTVRPSEQGRQEALNTKGRNERLVVPRRTLPDGKWGNAGRLLLSGWTITIVPSSIPLNDIACLAPVFLNGKQDWAYRSCRGDLLRLLGQTITPTPAIPPPPLLYNPGLLLLPPSIHYWGQPTTTPSINYKSRTTTGMGLWQRRGHGSDRVQKVITHLFMWTSDYLYTQGGNQTRYGQATR